MTSLTELLRRVEGATGPSRELDCLISAALFSAKDEPGYWSWRGALPRGAEPDERLFWDKYAIRLTGSIDNALALVAKHKPDWWGSLTATHGLEGERVWECKLRAFGTVAEAPTAPLAILSALLKARIAQEGGE